MTDKVKMSVPRREFLMRGGAGVLGTLVAASTLNITSAQSASVANVKANLKAIKMGDFNPNYATQWTYRLAQSLGYLEDGGINDLEVILSDKYIAGMVGKSLDIAHGDTSEFFGAGHSSGLPIKMISMHRDKEWWIMGVRKGINKPSDLKGGTITGGGLSGRNTWVMKQVIKKMGLDPEKDVNFVPTSGGSDKRMAAVMNGSVDGASMFPRHEAGLTGAGGKFLFRELTQAPQEGFAVMGEWLEKNEATAQAFVTADLRARRWLFNPKNKERAYQIMIDYGYEIPEAFKAMYSVELDQFSPDAGFESAAAMDTFVDDLAKTGGVPKGLDWRKYVEMKYVWAAQDSLGIPRRPATL